MDWKNRKKFLVLKIIAIESETRSSLNLDKDTCDWQSICSETSLRFNISLREIFFMSGSIRVTDISLSDMLDLRGVSKHIDYQWQVSFSRFRKLVVPDSNALSLQLKIFSDFFVPFLESTSNFKHFEKQDDCHSYFIIEITGCERRG